MDHRTLYEMELVKQLLDSKLYDGRHVKELSNTTEAGAALVTQVIRMFMQQSVDIGEAGQLIALAAKEYAISKGENGDQAFVDNGLSQLEIMRANFVKSLRKAKKLV